MKKTGIKIIAWLLTLVTLLGTLTACGGKATEGLEFTPMKDGTYAITGYTGTEVNIHIPAKYNGIKVTVIDEKTFAESQIQSITGGQNLEMIKESAFESCYMLKTVKLDGCKEIEAYAFRECTSLTKVSLPKTLTVLGGVAFMDCTALKSISIPNGIEKIGSSAFKNCSSLTKITIPNSVKAIDPDAFQNCNSLTSIKLPDSLTNIGYGAFKDCSMLTTTIPATVKSVGNGAFNTSGKITVEGSITGWSGSWCSKTTNVVYKNKDTSTSDVTIEYGTYCAKDTNVEIYLYINSTNITLDYEFSSTNSYLNQTWYTEKYSYTINGNTLVCSPDNSGKIVEAIYDKTAQTITWGEYTFKKLY